MGQLDEKDQNDDHDQDYPSKDLLHIWSWSSDHVTSHGEKRDKDDDHDQDYLTKSLLHIYIYIYGHGHLKVVVDWRLISTVSKLGAL